MFKNLSLRARMLMMVVGMVSLGFAVTILVMVRQGAAMQTQAAYAYVEQRVEVEATKIAQETEVALNTANVMAQMLKGMWSTGQADRQLALTMMKEVLSANPRFLGVWTLWEPNAFDGRDKQYSNTENHDATGRFIPYINRAGGEVGIDAIRDYENRAQSDYYFLALDSGEPVLLEPYTYDLEGVSTLMTSIAIPIKQDGKVLGVAGVDIALDSFQSRVGQIREYEIGYARLISAAGNYVGHRDASRVGQPVHQENQNLVDAIRAGDDAPGFVEHDRLLGENSYTVVAPVHIGDLNQHWALSMTVPLSRVLEQVSTLRNTSLLLGLLSISLVSLVLGWILTRLVIRPLGGEPAHASYIAAQIAQGDLTSSIYLSDTDKGSLLYAMRVMQAQLIGIISSIRVNSESVSEGAHQLSKANIDLSQRTEQQAAALQETAASLEQLSATVSQNADTAQRANVLVTKATQLATNGDAAVGNIVESMTQLTQSSQKMGDIISAIEGIAFQTNILALNAAVEAARAGEHGRGFAVVASEVRTLAQRTASAAQEVKSLIEGSIGMAADSTSKVDHASETIQLVVAAIADVSTLMAEIAAASLEQSDGLGQIHTAVTQMDAVTQQNAAMVEQAAAATASLEDQALALTEAVSIFKV